MPANLSPLAGRFTVDLPEVTRRQMLELMRDGEESARDCVIIAIAERHARTFGDPERDVFAELDALNERMASLERIAAEGYDRWYIVFELENQDTGEIEQVTYGPFLTRQEATEDMPRVVGLYTSIKAIG